MSSPLRDEVAPYEGYVSTPTYEGLEQRTKEYYPRVLTFPQREEIWHPKEQKISRHRQSDRLYNQER